MTSYQLLNNDQWLNMPVCNRGHGGRSCWSLLNTMVRFARRPYNSHKRMDKIGITSPFSVRSTVNHSQTIFQKLCTRLIMVIYISNSSKSETVWPGQEVNYKCLDLLLVNHSCKGKPWTPEPLSSLLSNKIVNMLLGTIKPGWNPGGVGANQSNMHN